MAALAAFQEELEARAANTVGDDIDFTDAMTYPVWSPILTDMEDFVF